MYLVDKMCFLVKCVGACECFRVCVEFFIVVHKQDKQLSDSVSLVRGKPL